MAQRAKPGSRATRGGAMLKKQCAALVMSATTAIVATWAGGANVSVNAQSGDPPLPNPYRVVENYFKLPEGRKMGSTAAVDIDHDGRSIWVFERCGGPSQ